ncbi:MAG: hypothetical protein HQL99_10790 [Magnetococcales bacterium]|nr:hypothetical protein [Magnetococcales bacterium]
MSGQIVIGGFQFNIAKLVIFIGNAGDLIQSDFSGQKATLQKGLMYQVEDVVKDFPTQVNVETLGKQTSAKPEFIGYDRRMRGVAKLAQVGGRIDKII